MQHPLGWWRFCRPKASSMIPHHWGGCRRQGVRPSSEGAGNEASTQALAWQPQARRRRRGSQWTKQIQPVTVSGRAVIVSRTLALSLEMKATNTTWMAFGRPTGKCHRQRDASTASLSVCQLCCCCMSHQHFASLPSLTSIATKSPTNIGRPGSLFFLLTRETSIRRLGSHTPHVNNPHPAR